MNGKMFRIAMVLLLAGMTLSFAFAQGNAGRGPAVRAVGVSVLDPKAEEGFESMPYSNQAGTHVYLQLSGLKSSIIGIDDEACKLETLKDDKGTNLLDPDEWLWPFEEISEKGKALAFTAQSEKIPAAGAKSLMLKGEMAVITGEDEKIQTLKNLAYQKGTELIVGEQTWTVTAIDNEGGWGDWVTAITFQSDISFDGVIEVAFLDAEGNEIESQLTSRSVMTGMGDTVYDATFSLMKQPEAFSLKVKYYATTKTLKVPFDLQVGLGM